MKKIGIDARLAMQTGVGVYIRNLIYHLEEMIDKDTVLYVYVRKEDRKNLPFGHKKNIVVKLGNQKWHSVSEQTSFARQLINDDLDLMHFTYFSYPVLYTRPFIITIHDLTPLLFKTGRASTHSSFIYNLKHLAYRFILSRGVHQSKRIIVPSVAVHNQLLTIYPKVAHHKVVVTHEGVSHDLIQAKENSSLAGIFKKPFFVYVGNFYPHKNVENMLKAFVLVKTDRQLILIGPQDFFSRRIKQLIGSLSAEDRIIFYHDATTADLQFFYKKAEALILPSLGEGFGLPLVEAAYFGLPVIASDISVVDEIMDKQYLPFNPHQPQDIARAIALFLKPNTQFKPDYKTILKRFSFKDMARQTLKVYET